MPSKYQRITEIDVHKSILFVVIGDEESEPGGWKRQRFGATTNDIKCLGDWLNLPPGLRQPVKRLVTVRG